MKNNSPIIGIVSDTARRRNRPINFVYKEYAAFVKKSGGVPVILPYIDNKDVGRIVSKLDGIIIAGGDDIDPKYYGEKPKFVKWLSPDERTEFEYELIRQAMRQRKPALGICYGCQIINVAFGGSLYQDIKKQTKSVVKHKNLRSEDVYHKIEISGRSILTEVLGKEIPVNSYHHQAVRRLGKGLLASAKSEDGLVEAVERRNGSFILGVQWHPECDYDNQMVSLELGKFFINICKKIKYPS